MVIKQMETSDNGIHRERTCRKYIFQTAMSATRKE